MDFQFFVTNGDFEEAQEIILTDPAQLKNLDKELTSWLLGQVIRRKMKDFVELIVEFGDNTFDPLHLAVFRGNIQSVEALLLSGKKPYGQEQYVFTLLRCLFWRKNIKIWKDMLVLLMKYGFDTGFQTPYGENVLHFFIRFSVNENDNDADKIVDILLNSGLPLYAIDNSGYSYMDHALCKHNFQSVSFLIKIKFDVNLKNGRLETPTFTAIRRGNERLLDLLLSNGAEVNMKCDYEETPLHFACFLAKEKLIYVLIKYKADINANRYVWRDSYISFIS